MSSPQADGTEQVYLTTNHADGIGLYSGAGTAFEKLQTIFIGDALMVQEDAAAARAKIGKAGQWIKVATPGGAKGWVDGGGVVEVGAETVEVAARTMYVWREGHALAGLHGPTEAWIDRWDDEAFQMIKDARIEAVKILAKNEMLGIGTPRIAQLKQKLEGLGVKFIMARLFSSFGEKRSEQDFVNDVGQAAKVLYDLGVRYFEVHNEPNLNLEHSREGMFVQWQNGDEFADFYLKSVALIKGLGMPDANFGYPGLSPVVPETAEAGSKYPMDKFLQESQRAVRAADFVCMHSYWGGDGTSYDAALKAIQKFCELHPDKLVLVTEFANTAPESQVRRDVKGDEYAKFYIEAHKLPSNLGAVFSYALKSAGDYSDQVWQGSKIAAMVGRRGTT